MCGQERQRADAATIADYKERLDKANELVAIVTSERDAVKAVFDEERQVREVVLYCVSPAHFLTLSGFTDLIHSGIVE